MGSSRTKQTAWEETHEEAQRRRDRAVSDEAGWTGTVIGLAAAAAALTVIMLTA